MGGALTHPDPELITPPRAIAVLKRLGLEWAAEPGSVILPPPPIVPVSPRPENNEWWVGSEVVVTYLGTLDDFPAHGPWASDRSIQRPAQCPYVATAVLVHAWNTPGLRPLFQLPAWALDLQPLTQAPAGVPPADALPGFIRYRLSYAAAVAGRSLGAPSLSSGVRLPPLLTREVVRLSRRDGRELRAVPPPDGLRSLESLVLGLTSADRTIHQALATRALLTPLGVDAPRVAELLGRLDADIFAALLHARELYLDDERLFADSTPFAPRIQITDAPDTPDALALDWELSVLTTFAVGPGYVVDTERRFRPIELSGLTEALPLLDTALPDVPRAEAGELLRRFLLTSRIPIEVRTTHLPPTVSAERVEGRVRLREDGDGLHIDLRVGYVVGDDAAEVVADEGPALVPVGDALVVRERAIERAFAERLQAHLGGPPPMVLDGNTALEFLLDGRRALGPDWAFFGDRDLLEHRVTGRLVPHVRVPSDVDWFDLRLDFSVGGYTVEGREVIESWLAGRHFHRLPDGTLARLPTQWLSRHGAVSAELEELRTVAGGRIPSHAAPVVAELLDEAHGDIARWRALLDRLRGADTVPDRPLPPGLEAELRAYQLSGYRWLAFLRDLGLGACLADDMGLGKTVQTIAVLLDTHRPAGSTAGEPRPTSLVVAPTSVVPNWYNELTRFSPSLRIHVHHGAERALPAESEQVDVIITSYPLLRADQDALVSREWTYVVLDEAQQIKNPSSQVARAARALNARHRLALSGTPLENHLLELWSIFEFLMPGFFGARAVFQRRYGIPIERDRDAEALTSLRRRLRPFVLRRHKTEVAQELPPRQESVLYCELGAEQRELYERVKSTFRRSVLGKVRRVGVGGAALSVLEALMRLRQACCDPGLLPFAEARAVNGSAKIELLMHTLNEAVENGHRTLVFSQWPSLLRRVVAQIDAAGWDYLYLDGSTTRRQVLVDQWNEPDGPPVFLISLKAGGAGLNLTGADHVIHLDPWWNPAVEDQATDRAHRIGQTRPVVAYKLVARDTVEEKILELQARKRALFQATISADRAVVESLTVADLEAVFRGDETHAPLTLPRGSAGSDEAAVAGPNSSGPRPGGVNGRSGPPAEVRPLPAAEPPPGRLARHLRPGVRLTNAQVRDLTGWDADEARRWLQVEVAAGRLEKRGQRRGTHYVVAR